MTTNARYLHPRDEIMQTMERIYRYRMTTTSGGNLSIREPDGAVWVTPARVDKGGLRRDDIVRVTADGRNEGLHPPSSELPFHQMIYAARPDILGVVHAHAVALVAFSITRRVPDTRLFHQSRHVCGRVGFAPYALPGSDDLGRRIAETFQQGFDCVVLENHGVAIGGRSLQHAFQRFETLEFTAKTVLKASLLGEVHYLSDAELELRERVPTLEEFDPGEPSSREKEQRRRLVEFTQRGYRQRLFISTGGSFSARVDEDAFLITPSRFDRHALAPEDLVLVRGGRRERGRLPSRAARNHQSVYEHDARVGAVLNASPVNVTAFSVTRAALDSRTIPESYLLLRDVARLPYGVQFEDPEALGRQVNLRSPIALLENDGVMVAGASVLEAFDRLEVLESTAEALINSRLLGDVAPMSDEVIDDLKRAFAAMLS
ncbi:MAG TPA: class II aldolase/adducin family protein [Pyrinomonadaceae bacterium]|jgi:L-fuculose-phosphate aldolase|nr:class II aldolase/adducin family protein [Pyrinomonadaceae bacterium]